MTAFSVPDYTYTTIDSEFTPNNLTPSGLISLGIACDNGGYYAVNAETDVAAILDVPWMVENVWKHLPHEGNSLDLTHPDVKPYETIRDEVDAFFEDIWRTVGRDINRVRAVVRCGSQDMVRLHTLWNNDWINEMPEWIPNYSDDMKRMLLDSGMDKSMLPEQDPAGQHHALRDAEYELSLIAFLRGSVDMATVFSTNQF